MITEFNERLQELLADNNISRFELAKNINVASTTLNGYFNKGYFPRLDIAIKIADYFGCSIDYLFGFSDEINDFDKNENAFIDNLNFLIKQNNKSVAKTLSELNMSEYDYYRWKKGMFPKTANLILIAKYFNVPLSFLIGNKLK